MPSIRLFPRYAFLLLAVVAMTSCVTSGVPGEGYPPSDYPKDAETRNKLENFCTAGNGSKGRPLICIDQTTLMANPDPAKIWDVEADGGKPTNRRVVVHWFTQKTADLAIRFNTSGCVGRIRCDGRGHCWTTVRPLDVDAQGKKIKRDCKYTIDVDGRTKDPDLEINPCCW